MKISLKIFFLLLLPVFSGAQQNHADSLRKIFLGPNNDSVLYAAAIQLYDYYEELNRDSALFYADQTVLLSRKNNKKLNEAYSLNRQAYQELNLGRFESSLHHLLDAFSICGNKKNDDLLWEIEPLRSETSKRLYVLSTTHHIFALLMRYTGSPEQELIHFREAKRIAVEINNPARSLLGSLNLGRIYWKNGKLDSGLVFENEAEQIAMSSGRKRYLATIFNLQGMMWMDKGDTSRALHLFYESIKAGKEQNNYDGMVRTYDAVFGYYLARKNNDSALYYARQKLETLKTMGAVSNTDYHLGSAYESLYQVYQSQKKFDSAYKYLALAYSINDSVNKSRIRSLSEFQSLTLGEQQRIQNAEKESVNYRNKIRISILLAGIAILLLLAIIFYRNNLQKQKAKIKIEQAYDDLKATQQQLIHAEKMASLGELTAGIAHEIQNPLNFVNNFSEVNNELVDELNEQLAAGNISEAKTIAGDIKQNEEKISHHGKRADAIVKGMLQHSRSSSGQKESTDLNALVEEYARLAYHGWRAKDKINPVDDETLNVAMKTDFDKTIGQVSLIPGDFGRVLLNLLNNAFYVVSEKRNMQVKGYEPFITISTKKMGNKIEMRVSDNGNGIPKDVLEKIFQPFFTTKPTGQGTGLGLSLSYDIIKAHGGELKVETKEGEGTSFIVIIPG